ncbi:MAG: sulfatase-like hydrolase/transferase, partial [Elusimicrobiaceae bacterium]|nr:sulfatase-like hydrolase/transferase [Elusimicrobiaceae bacterium]
SPFVFNTFHDDVYAIVKTAIDQYHAVWHVLWGIVYGVLSGWLLSKAYQLAPRIARPALQTKHKKWVVIGFCILLVPLAVFLRKGGAFNYTHSIYWKNSARMSQHILNETILDDVQALYKASRIYKQFSKEGSSLTAQEVRAALTRLTGKEYTADTLLPFLTRTAPGAVIKKPSHIFVIVGETYMMWPLLDKYKDLPIAKGMRELAARPDSILLDKFISASNGTMFGLTSVLLGLPEVNQLTANRPTAEKPYESALSVQLKKLGYKTHFFYGGFPSWENVGLFMQYQQMDHSYYYADFGGKGTVWGVPDKPFLAGIDQYISDEPSFNLILTSTNHPPFVVDMKTEPEITSAAQMAQFVPSSSPDKKLMVERLQHFEYADKYLTDFVKRMQAKYPDSLFIITGDHADRWTMDANPSGYERLAVPLLIMGKGIKKSMLTGKRAGAHMDIMATVMELILPKGETYYGLGENVLTRQNAGLHAYHYMTPDVLGNLGDNNTELLPGDTQTPSAEQTEKLRQRLKDLQVVATWRILHGVELQ